MAKTQLTKNTTTGNWELTETNQDKHYTNTLLTAGLPMEGDIKIDITAKNATANMPSDLNGTGATASLSGTTLTLSKNLTNTATVTTAGWLSSLSGITKVKLSGTVPTETKTASGSGDITPSTGKLLSKVTVPSGSASVNNSTITPTFSRTGDIITVTGSTTTTGSVGTAGWISSITSGTSSIASTGNTYTIPTETGSATPTTSSQTLIPSSGKLFNSVTVDAIPSEYIIPSGTINLTSNPSGGTNVTSYAKATIKSGSASVNNSSITPSFSQSGKVITVTGSVTTTGSATEGWVSSVTSGTSSIASTGNTYTIPSAGNFSLAITDKASTNLTVGTLSSGYYPFTTSLTGTLTASVGGYFTSGSATDSSVTVGRLPASAPSASVVVDYYPEVDVSGTATGFTPSSSATSHYVTLNGIIPDGKHGRVKAKYTNSTAGYAPQNTSGTESDTTVIYPNIFGDGTKIYIPDATANMPSDLNGTGATASLNSTTLVLTLTKNLTNTATISTSGWLSSLSGTTKVKLSGTVPTETKTVTPTDQEQLVEPTSGKLLSSVTVEGLYKTVPSTSDIVSSSNVYKIVGKLMLHVTSGSSSNSVVIEDDYIKITSATTSGTSSSASATITYQLLETNGTSTPSWTTKTVSASQSSVGAPLCTIKYTGKIIRCSDSTSGSTVFANASSSSSTTYPYGTFSSSGQYFKTIGFFELYASGGSSTQYRYAKAKYYRKVSAGNYGSNTSTTYPHTKGGTATIEYSNDGTTWTSINAYSSQGTTATGWGTGAISLRVFTDAYILFD